MTRVFPPEWRTQTRWKRRFYARYMTWLERAGYVLVAGVFAAFVAAFNVRVEDVVSADGAALVPFARPLSTKEPARVVRLLAQDLAEVERGQPLLEVVVGDDAIRRHAAWEAYPDRFPKPATTVLTSPAKGTFRLDAKAGAVVEAEAPMGRVVDYADLRVEASLTGDTVALASADDVARVVKVAVAPVAGTLFRGGGGVSGQALGAGVKAALEKGLVGRGIALRDDVPLRVTEVKEVQVDARVAPGGAVAWDPPADATLAARVIEGAPSATAQIADLPSGAVAEAVRAQFGEAREVRAILKVKAGPGAGSGLPIPGTVLSRAYDAKLKLTDPPASLVRAVRDADRDGRAVTCRVELRTGERPAALRLLKKS